LFCLSIADPLKNYITILWNSWQVNWRGKQHQQHPLQLSPLAPPAYPTFVQPHMLCIKGRCKMVSTSFYIRCSDQNKTNYAIIYGCWYSEHVYFFLFLYSLALLTFDKLLVTSHRTSCIQVNIPYSRAPQNIFCPWAATFLTEIVHENA